MNKVTDKSSNYFEQGIQGKVFSKVSKLLKNNYLIRGGSSIHPKVL